MRWGALYATHCAGGGAVKSRTPIQSSDNSVVTCMKQQNACLDQKTLLVVDDDAPFLRVLGRAMAQQGFAVWPAETVEEAKAAVHAIRPDCAVVDLHLSGASGFEVLEYINEHSRGTRVVLVSGYVTPALAVRAMKLGATDCLAKPVDMEMLMQSLVCDEADAKHPPEVATEPSEVRLQHVLAHWEKNDRNTMQTAKMLGMHRRTLQRILKRAGIGRDGDGADVSMTHFGKLRRLYQLWSRSMAPKATTNRARG